MKKYIVTYKVAGIISICVMATNAAAAKDKADDRVRLTELCRSCSRDLELIEVTDYIETEEVELGYP